MAQYAYMIIGQPSLDVNTDHLGVTVRETGGAVVYSAYAASALGHSVLALGKCNPAEIDLPAVFARAARVTLAPCAAQTSTSIANTYHTADKERRTCRVISRIPAYTPADLPTEGAAIYHIAGLMRGDIEESVIEEAAKRGMVAVDVQGFLRCVRPDGSMEFEDWPRKKELLPRIRFLKTDAAEAEILTGTDDRRRAAAMLADWGAQEIMITHNTEVLIFAGGEYTVQPLRPRNLSGRSGRGDTCFASYITERAARSIPEALQTAAALVSCKMEQPGPFAWDRAVVEQYIRNFYA
ncbi:MAG: PfkB family carbohydrate kinase [Oscillospiraceae bacterium]|jgi:sugar/nucleoside kinase (ribokinase family)|nr:PfkB family carbohydrate kinase [Oscillospiraceae bacterium]